MGWGGLSIKSHVKMSKCVKNLYEVQELTLHDEVQTKF